MADTAEDQASLPSETTAAPPVPRSLATQLVILVAAVVVVAVAGVSLLAAHRVEQAVFARETVRFKAENDRLASELSSDVARVRDDVLAILHVGAAQQLLRDLDSGASNDRAQTASREALAKLFSADLLARPLHLQFRLIDVRHDGRELVRVDRSGAGGTVRVVPAEDLQSKRERDYVQHAAKLPPGEVYVSSIDLNREHGKVEKPHVPVLRAATPVYSDAGEVAAVLVVNVDMRPALAKIVPFFETGRIFLLADSGDFVVHPDPERTFGSALGRDAWWRKDFGRLAEIIDRNATVPLQYTYKGNRQALVGTSVEIAARSRAYLLQSVPEAQIVAPARHARRVTAIAGLVAVLLASALSWKVARSLTRPITRMTAAVSNFTGTEEVDVPVSARGEIGVLARSFQAMARDIVERTARERLYVAVVESSDDAILATDLAGAVVAWNPASERLFGYDREEALGKSIDVLIPPPRQGEFSTMLARALEGGEIARYESSRCHRDGRLIPVAVTESPVRTPDGEVIGISKIVRDVTPQMEAEERFRLAVESSPSGMMMVDAAGEILMVNAQIERVFGYDRTDLIGQSVEVLVPDRVCDRHVAYREDYARKPETRPMGANRELFGRRRDGSQFPIEIGLSPLATSAGLRVIATVVDISERRRAASRLQSYATRLERSNADLENFAYVTSHDLKAPLRGISSVASWLAEDLDDLLDDDQRENLGLMLERTARLNNLIDGILEYSRVGRSDLDLGPIDAAKIVDDVIAAMTMPEGLSARVDGELPTVVFEATQLRQVFQNLIDNAIKHIGKPIGEVTVSCERAKDEWCFEVRDTGVGIPERHFERIFMLFHTLRPKDEAHATGLGLAIVKRIVENRGGTVSVSSTLGEGTAFRFTVPDAVNGAAHRDDEGAEPT